MNLFLTLHLLDDKFSFPSPLFIGEDIQSFDLDNYSDDLVVSTALKAIQQARKIVALINVRSDGPLGAILKVLNALSRRKDPLLLIHNGDHPTIHKMLRMFDPDKVLNNVSPEEIKDRALNFFAG